MGAAEATTTSSSDDNDDDEKEQQPPPPGLQRAEGNQRQSYWSESNSNPNDECP